jgi:predicted nucleic acid-binding protein
MLRVFADTGYWIGLLNPRDELHDKAFAASREYDPSEIATSETVLTEFLNAFSDYGSRLRLAAASAVISLQSSNVTIVPQTSRLFADALHRYREMSDKSWSLTDCFSFIVMQAHGIQDALTHDRHFAQAGFQVLLRQKPPFLFRAPKSLRIFTDSDLQSVTAFCELIRPIRQIRAIRVRVLPLLLLSTEC